MAQQINLYDPALERQRDWLALVNVVSLAAILLVGVVLAGIIIRRDLPSLTAQTTAADLQLKTVREQVTTLGQQISSRKPDPRLIQELATGRSLLAVRQEVLDALRHGLGSEARSMAEVLRGFARQTITGLWLTELKVEADSGRMEIRGNTLDPATLPGYIQRLNQEAAFRGQTFAALRLDLPKTAATTPAPESAATPSAPAAPRWHEFMLIPERETASGASTAVSPAPTPAAPTGRAG